MKVLITGATGFIGSHLAEALLKEGAAVTCLVRDTSNIKYLDGLNVRLIKGDCTEEGSLTDAVRDTDYIFHLAGITKTRSEDESFMVNVKGTENIIKAALKAGTGVKRFVYLSSLAAAGPSCNGQPLKEDCETKPVSIYGKTKLAGEKIVYEHRDRLPVTIIRPPAVYGPRDRDFLVFFKMVKSGLVPYWGKCFYSFLYVEDLINGIILSALSDKTEGEIFFMSDGNVYSTDEIIEAISEAVQKVPAKLNVPKFVMPLLGFASEKFKGVNIINSDKIKEMRHTHWICDNSKAVSKIGFQPKVKMMEGAKWTADWYRIHQWI